MSILIGFIFYILTVFREVYINKNKERLRFVVVMFFGLWLVSISMDLYEISKKLDDISQILQALL